MDRIVLESAAAVTSYAARLVAEEISMHDQILLGLAGGSTPRALHEQLADAPIDWNGITTWLTDERWVPRDDPESNQNMVRSSLHTSGRIRFLAPNTHLEYPEAAAARMARSLGCLSNGKHDRMVTFLGLGDDGHTASLFPGTKALDVDDASYVANWVPKLDAWRLTTTFRALAQSDVVVFLATGESKAEMVAQIAAGEDFPAGRVEASKRVIWLLDEAAASRLA